ncbi:MAG: hypothetical protein KGH64_01195, partial [Candidatus Micrarchaeota archaeon]|nr:hypothetical protein [Candidatus Micrarchaeota archaeon]
ITQLLVILILLVSWPYMLAAGILLRSFTFTRRAGGLIIALTIVGTIIYPMLLLFQYASLSNISSQTYNQCIVSHGGPSTSADNACSAYTGAATFIGADKVPALSLCGANLRPDSSSPTNYDYQIYCYTSSSTLPTNTIYKDIPLPAGSPSTISACSGSPWTTSPPEPGTSSTKVPSCYVRKTLSFYTFPSAAGAIALYTCYIPYKGSAPDSLIGFEETVLLQNVVSSPLTLLQSFTQGQFFSSVTSNPLNQEVDGTGPPCNIGPIYIWASIASLINIYGLISVISFILPILNILLMLSATAGISHLIGGETSITGLTRFI